MKTTTALAFLLLSLCCISSVQGQRIEWTRQFGTSESDRGSGVSTDGLGNVYISGFTEGSLGGTNAGGNDAFLRKYNASGTLQWTRQFGSSENDQGNGVSADGFGGVYITGRTDGSLEGTNAGGADAFLRKYDASGTHQWTRQLGTTEGDFSFAVSADGVGDVYISGGNRIDLGGGDFEEDAFVTKYDANGTHQWTQQLGSSNIDRGFGVSADGLGSVYITGFTLGDLEGTHAGGITDAFLSKYNASGTHQWTRQFGTNSEDLGYGVSADGLGGVYITGRTEGSLDGTGEGDPEGDSFVIKYDSSGTHQWTQQFGTDAREGNLGVSADGLGSVYTAGSLAAPNAGDRDVLVAKFTDLSADFNSDNKVDGDDLGIWEQNYGLSDPFGHDVHEFGDADGDAGIAGMDFLIWQREFGSGFGIADSASSAAVPEPTTCTLALAALCLAMSRRRAF